MSVADTSNIERALAESFVYRHTREAARSLNAASAKVIAAHLEAEKVSNAAALLEAMEPEKAAESIVHLKDEPTRRVLRAMNPAKLAPLLARLEEPVLKQNIDLLDEPLAQELRALLSYPPNTAGSLMDPRFLVFPATATVLDVTERLQTLRKKRVLDIPIVNEEDKLVGLLTLQDVLLANADAKLGDLVQGPPPSVHVMSTKEEVVEILNQHRITTLPAVDLDNRLLGIIRYSALMQAVRDDAATNMQTMVGVSKDERALSSSLFAVRKRLPWLQINLLTAFLAAAVVGLFEGTIAKYTALAVMLPIAAGQSGNAGAQALAVTMRGLTLREISMRHWLQVMTKEFGTGLINGIGTAITCGAGIYVWSRSFGLALVMALAMIISMTIAGVAGALVPIVLKRFGMDPAQSSSIVLTTITDIAGFLSFLGIATLLSNMLDAG